MDIDFLSSLSETFSFLIFSLMVVCGLIVVKKRYTKKKKPYIHDPIDKQKLKEAEKALNLKLKESKSTDHCIIAKGSTLEGFDYNWANKVIGILASNGISATYKSFDTANYIAQFHILVPLEQRDEAAIICAKNNIKVYI